MEIDIATELNEQVLSRWPPPEERADFSPFLEPAFWQAMLSSQGIGGDSGWQPLFILFDDEGTEGLLLAFLKSHSYGEYVFDWQWANAYHEAGLAYYPKLLCALPFTPIAVPKVFIRGQESKLHIGALINAIMTELKLSSWHYLYNEHDGEDNRFSGSLQRHTIGFNWHNRGYQNFNDYLGALKSKTRKSIRRERRQIENYGLSIHTHEGNGIDESLLAKFYACYAHTYWIRQQRPYLSEAFFKAIIRDCPGSVVLIAAYKDSEKTESEGIGSAGELVACSWFFRNEKRLYGRYWGSLQHYDCLHFELCYYQGIEYCINHNLQSFDPGTQGQHKARRGFEPEKISSYHGIANPGFHQAIARYCEEERAHINDDYESLRLSLPFR